MRRQPGNGLALLLREAEQQLATLRLPTGFTFAQLHGRIEQHRGRQVNLIPRHLPALAPHGLWIAGEHADYVFYAADAGQVRQRLIIGHEYGHMLFDDGSTAGHRMDLAPLLRPEAGPAKLEFVLARRGYDQPVERRAELFGTLAVQRVESWSDLPLSGPADPAVSARLVATLEGRPAPW